MKKTAFSLIELSVVILIIGILIAGVTQSSRLVAQFRLSSARTLTQSSPVASISNLVLWLETTSEKSFDSAATDDGVAINSGKNYGWYDINPQNPRPYSATSATGPTYKENCINGLPCLAFNGSTQFLDLPQMGGPTPQTTIFAVFNEITYTALVQEVFAGATASGFTSMQIFTYISSSPVNNMMSYTSGSGGVPTVSPNYGIANNPVIFDAVDTGILINIHYSAPGSSLVSPTATSVTLANKDFTLGACIGCFHNNSRLLYFNGYIAEIIMFDRALKNEERQAVESYLSKKWGIKI